MAVQHIFSTLIVILAIDAFRTLFESIYFGFWYTSLAGLIPSNISVFLMRPEMVIIPKLINVLAAIVVIILLLKRWLPKEQLEQEKSEEALAESEMRWQFAVDGSELGLWDWDIINETYYRSKAIEHFFGEKTPKNLSPENFWEDSFHEEDIENLKKSIQPAVDNPDCF